MKVEEFVMEKLIIHTNKIVANKGTRSKDVTESITTPELIIRKFYAKSATSWILF